MGKEYHVGIGYEYTKIRDAAEDAVKHKNSVVIIHNGTYDLCSEFAAEISESREKQYGICLENGIHIISCAGVIIEALYTGNDVNVTTWFSPFYGGANGGGFTLENICIYASNTRYCVHDEYCGNDVYVNNKYINCKMVFDNTSAPINYYAQCIGGGCAKNSYVEIRNCYFRTKLAMRTPTDTVSYHNGDRDNAVSKIIVSNSFIDGKGRFRFSHYGRSVLISSAIVNNCSTGSPNVLRYELSEADTPQNFELLEYNNHIHD